MREIKYQAFDDIVKIMVEWGTLKASPILFMNIVNRRVKHYILRQYTGLKDGYEKEIYEGDLVVILGADRDIYQVTMAEALGKWICEINVQDNFDLDGETATGIVVVGNIYENTELLGCGDE